MASNAALQLDGSRARLSGALDRAAVVALWPQLQSLSAQLTVLDLQAVTAVDSAGLALLAELTARAAGRTLELQGTPPGFTELSAAYRLDASLDFNALSAAS